MKKKKINVWLVMLGVILVGIPVGLNVVLSFLNYSLNEKVSNQEILIHSLQETPSVNVWENLREAVLEQRVCTDSEIESYGDYHLATIRPISPLGDIFTLRNVSEEEYWLVMNYTVDNENSVQQNCVFNAISFLEGEFDVEVSSPILSGSFIYFSDINIEGENEDSVNKLYEYSFISGELNEIHSQGYLFEPYPVADLDYGFIYLNVLAGFSCHEDCGWIDEAVEESGGYWYYDRETSERTKVVYK